MDSKQLQWLRETPAQEGQRGQVCAEQAEDAAAGSSQGHTEVRQQWCPVTGGQQRKAALLRVEHLLSKRLKDGGS